MPEGKQSGAYVPPNGGDSVWLAGIHITVKLTSEDTRGAYAMTEEITPPQGEAPPHAHDREDEALYVLEGEVEFLLGEDTIPARACAYALRGTLHVFKNVGTSPRRVLVVYSPGGFEKFFFEADEPAPEGSSPPEGEPDVGRIVEIGQKYGSKYRHLLLGSNPFRDKASFCKPGCQVAFIRENRVSEKSTSHFKNLWSFFC